MFAKQRRLHCSHLLFRSSSLTKQCLSKRFYYYTLICVESHFKAMNELYFRISWDFDFLQYAHQDVIHSDEFTRNMMNILKQIHKEGIKQPITLLTQRAVINAEFLKINFTFPGLYVPCE